MPTITLPDGSKKVFDKPVTALEVAQSIGKRLAADALGAKIDGELRDLSTVIDRDASIAIVTPKSRDGTVSKDALFLIRHSAAHVMAEAIQRVLGKNSAGFERAQLVFGPPTENGFFYDMAVNPDRPITSADFSVIEREMGAIIAENRKFTRYELPIGEAIGRAGTGENRFKRYNAYRAAEQFPREAGVPLQSEHSDVGTFKFPQNARLSFYVTGEQGRNWEDLCKGPHVPSTGRIGAVKVMSLASSYWQGDETKDRLTRVYGTAFGSQEELDAHLKQLEEAKHRDHRVIGKQLRLFHIDEDVGQGLILWTPAGSIVRQELQDFVTAELKKRGYQQVFTPHIGRLELYKTSGHFPYYKDSQYAPVVEREALSQLMTEGCSCAEMMNRVEGVSARLAKGLNERTGRETIAPDRVLPDDKLVDGYLLKPMNCPHHVKIFKSQPHSYRDMPVRLAEFGTVYRWEQSGELTGLTRVRSFTVDDAHLFCTEDQIPDEVRGCLELVKITFGMLGMRDYRVRLGLRDADSNKYTGGKESWDKAEAACRDAATTLGVPFSEEPGEAAFYGPKIDFIVKDVIGREWQLGTVQVDYNLPVRFDLSYIGPDNHPHRPVMIHRAPFGSMERFCGVLIEHFAGAFPTWLSPEQVRVIPISEKTNEYAARVQAELKDAGIRAGIDTGNDRVQAKIKVAADEKVPYMAIVGPRDQEQNQVSVRARGIQKDLGAMGLTEFVAKVKAEIASRAATLTIGEARE